MVYILQSLTLVRMRKTLLSFLHVLIAQFNYKNHVRYQMFTSVFDNISKCH